MSGQRLYILSGSIGQVEFDNDWFQTENTEIYMDKAIPLFHLISNLVILIENYPETANEFIKTATNLAKVMQKLKN